MSEKSNRRKLLRESRLSSGLCMYCGQAPHVVHRKGCSDCLQRCVRVNAKYSRQHPSKLRNYRLKVRLAVIEKYGGRCECCGEDIPEFLVIDHKNNDGCHERRELYGSQNGSSYAWYLKLRKESKRDDLRLLCYNCNNAIFVFGKCPHEPEEESSPRGFQHCLSKAGRLSV